MGMRFRRSIKIAPGLRFNVSKNSCGFSVGGRGAHVSVNSKGRVTTSTGIPGTGVSYVEQETIGSGKRRRTPSSQTASAKKPVPAGTAAAQSTAGAAAAGGTDALRDEAETLRQEAERLQHRADELEKKVDAAGTSASGVTDTETLQQDVPEIKTAGTTWTPVDHVDMPVHGSGTGTDVHSTADTETPGSGPQEAGAAGEGGQDVVYETAHTHKRAKVSLVLGIILIVIGVIGGGGMIADGQVSSGFLGGAFYVVIGLLFLLRFRKKNMQ